MKTKKLKTFRSEVEDLGPFQLPAYSGIMSYRP